MGDYDHEVQRMTKVNDEALDSASEANDRLQRHTGDAYRAYALHCSGIDPGIGRPYSAPACDRCGGYSTPFQELPAETICWDCWDEQKWSDADRAYDASRDREMWEGE